MTPFAVPPYLCVPFRPFEGAAGKADAILAQCVAAPERFLVSRVAGVDPRVVVAARLTDPRNAAFEVWQNDTFCGNLLVDRIDPGVDARCHLVFFDDELSSKAPLVREFLTRVFAEWGLTRLTLEVPAHMTTLTGFARRKLGFAYEGGTAKPSLRECAYFDGAQWRDVATLRLFAGGVR